jgi:hypothetical protein
MQSLLSDKQTTLYDNRVRDGKEAKNICDRIKYSATTPSEKKINTAEIRNLMNLVYGKDKHGNNKYDGIRMMRTIGFYMCIISIFISILISAVSLYVSNNSDVVNKVGTEIVNTVNDIPWRTILSYIEIGIAILLIILFIGVALRYKVDLSPFMGCLCNCICSG